jgi:quinol monooxygenase YgiN
MNAKFKIAIAVVAAVVLIVAAMLLPLSGRDAAAQSAGVYIVAVDLDIVPSETAKFLEAMKENGELAIKEGGCREFNITVLASDPNHVFLYEVYDTEAALAGPSQHRQFQEVFGRNRQHDLRSQRQGNVADRVQFPGPLIEPQASGSSHRR